MSITRNGFDKSTKGTLIASANDDQLKGTSSADFVDGQGGDDVIIGFKGEDTLIGGDGSDDLSGGNENDTLIGGIWVDASDSSPIDNGIFDSIEWTQDGARDDYVASGSFSSNGEDTILGFDDSDNGDGESVDVIEIDALVGALNAIAAAEFKSVAEVTVDDLIEGGYLSYDTMNGELSVDLDGGGNFDVWFNVLEYDDALNGITSAADLVTVEITGYAFTLSFVE